MRKLVYPKDIYSNTFFVNMDECPIISYVIEILNDNNIPENETKYYKWLKELLDKHGSVWGYINNEEDIADRVIQFKELINSIYSNGYKKELCPDTLMINGNKYGELTAYKDNDKIYLVDGHHRISILMALGIEKIEIDIFNI